MAETAAFQCPQCGSSRLWKDGFRYLADGLTVQRWFCRNCQNRFSEQHNDYKVSRTIGSRQISAILQDAKNLTPRTELKTVPEVETQHQDTKGKLVEYAFYMEKQGYAKETIRTNDGCLRALQRRNADLLNPESVKEVLAREKSEQKQKAQRYQRSEFVL